MKKEISLDNKKYFDIFIGKRVLKSEVFNSKGDIPVYSANVFEPFGFLEKSNIEDFSHNYLLWGIDGKFEFNIIKKNTKFATTDHCGCIKILDDNILPEYLLFELELQSHILGFDRTLRPSLTNMKNEVDVKIPINKSGDFDKEAQNKIVKDFVLLKKIKNDLEGEIEEISNITLDLELPKEKTLTLKIKEIFDLNKTTNHSKFTKSFVNKHPGEIPVYSASKDPNLINYGYVKDNLSNVKYFDNCLTWNIDGSVGKAFFRKGRFSLSEKVIPLIIRDKWSELIDPTYVKYVLEKKAVEKGFAFTNKANKTRIKDIDIEIPAKKADDSLIPDIEKQKQYAEKYQYLYDMKEGLVEQLQDLKEISVEL